MNHYSHLHPGCIDKLKLDVESRVNEILKPRWVGYPLVRQIMQQFDDLIRHPKVSRMPNLMLIGTTNNGKTDLIKRFCNQHPPKHTENKLNAPVLYLQAPPSPNESDLYSAILSSLYERIPSSSTSAKRIRTIEVLKKINLKVLCIDELHNSMAGSSVKRQQFLNAIKYIGNELSISIIACGTEDLIRAVSIDPQIQNRFQPILLPKWRSTTDFRQLLKTFESILPLKNASNLHTGSMYKKIHALSEGTIGELSMLLNKAAIYAIRNGHEKIDDDALNKCGYVSPSDRSREIKLY